MVLLSSVSTVLKRGQAAPGFSLPDMHGKTVRLAGFKGSKAVLVVFMCNHCPYVKHKIPAIVALHNEFRGRGLAVIGINSNDPAQYPEDAVEGMRAFAAERAIAFPYLVDETQAVAKSYGASCTPDPFLLDASLRLAYHGRLDDALEPGTTPATAEMRQAIQQLLAGKPVTVPELPSIGCSIKWRGGNRNR